MTKLKLHQPKPVKPRLTTRERGYDHQWQKTRFRELKETPFCEVGFDGCRLQADHVHHKDHNLKNYKPDNLMSSCERCHMKHHRSER